MRYFISGAQGFVGRYLVAHILASTRQARIFGVGRSPRQDHSFTHRVRWAARSIAAPLPGALKVFANRRYEYVSMDLVNEGEVASALQAFRPDVVIHLASGLRDDAPSLLFKTNVEGTIALMEAIAIAGIPLRKIVLGSTGGVYGVPQTVPIDEEDPCNPIDIYSLSKLAAEQVSRILMRRRRLPVVYAPSL